MNLMNIRFENEYKEKLDLIILLIIQEKGVDAALEFMKNTLADAATKSPTLKTAIDRKAVKLINDSRKNHAKNPDQSKDQ